MRLDIDYKRIGEPLQDWEHARITKKEWEAFLNNDHTLSIAKGCKDFFEYINGFVTPIKNLEEEWLRDSTILISLYHEGEVVPVFTAEREAYADDLTAWTLYYNGDREVGQRIEVARLHR